jgi:hypothetical protein
MPRFRFMLADGERAELNAFNLSVNKMSTPAYLQMAEQCFFAGQPLPPGKVAYYWDITHTTRAISCKLRSLLSSEPAAQVCDCHSVLSVDCDDAI